MRKLRLNKTTEMSGGIFKLLILLLGFSFVACTDDLLDNSGNNQEGGSVDEAFVRMTIMTPGSSVPKAATRSIGVTEYSISQIKVLVFDKQNNAFRYMVDGQEIKQSDTHQNITSFTALLKSSTDPVKLLFVANGSEVFRNYTPLPGSTEEEIKSNLKLGFSGEFPNGLPMFGEGYMAFLDPVETNNLTIKMLRSVARVDVETNLDLTQTNKFQLKSTHIFRANNVIQVGYNEESLSSSNELKVLSPSVPADVAAMDNSYKKEVEIPGQNSITGLYVPEAKYDIDPTFQQTGSTCVVVGGYYNDSDKPTYYRADFNSGLEGHPFGQVLRNYKYHFIITKVNGPGWETPEEAARNKASLITFEIQAWEDFTMEMYIDGENYMGVDSRKVIFGYKEDLKKIVGVESTVPYKISWIGQEETTTAGGSAVSNEYFSAQIINLAEDLSDVSHILITTLKENKTSAPFTATLKVEWSRWTFTIEVYQKQYSEATMRSVRILTAGAGTGALGAIAGGNQGGNMRSYLINPANFSPEGTVDYFAGFSFAQLLAEYFNDNVSAANLNRVKAEIYAADVIYLNNDNRCGKIVAAIINEWLNGSPNRVLILGGDADGTSMGFLRNDFAGLALNDVEWRFNLNYLTTNQYESIQTSGTGTFSYYPLNVNNKDILRGPFGDVNLNEKMNCADRIFGYAKEIKSKNIVPLLYHSNSPVATPYMTFGVDKVRRIFYHGDASTFEVGRLPSTQGVVSTNNEIFWANAWAWIAHQVIWGDDELVEI